MFVIYTLTLLDRGSYKKNTMSNSLTRENRPLSTQKCSDWYYIIMFVICVQNVDFYLIKWQGWASCFNSWEPKSNLECPELVDEYHHKLQLGKRSAISVMSSLEPETKQRRIQELVDQLVKNDTNVNAPALIEVWKQFQSKTKDSLTVSTCAGFLCHLAKIRERLT